MQIIKIKRGTRMNQRVSSWEFDGTENDYVEVA